MKVESIQYSVEEMVLLRANVDPKPQYQRTPVWKLDRKRLLIDSILRGYDLPKFYLNDITGNAFYNFEVCDGQQRLRAIWEFYEDKFSLGKNVSYDNVPLDNLKFSELSKDAKEHFQTFKLTIAKIVEADHNEIRDLFARLQKGMGLNQAELRRALSSHIGSYVESIVDNHIFFKKCGFPDLRNKHQDYIDHVIAFLVNGFANDFKGQSLQDVYMNVSPIQATQLIRDIANVLDDMEKINSFSVGIFRNKWAFVDSFILLYQFREKEKKVIPKEFTKAFNDFEVLRKSNNKNPRLLIEKVSPNDEEKRLYDYITSFTKDGSLKNNMKKRNDVFQLQFAHLFK